MKLTIPSKGRPLIAAKTQKVVPSAEVYVPENQADDYRKASVANVVPVPDSVRGITKTRNWILDHCDDDFVVMFDDDLKGCGFLHMYEANAVHEKMTEAQILGEFWKLFELTLDLGFRIWGLQTDSAPRTVYPYKPFMLRSYITASCMGIVNDGRTRFDESFPVKEDYELCLRCIKEDGGVLAVRYGFYWENNHWQTEGGCKDYRTQQMEAQCIARLIRMYPGWVRRVTKGGSEYSIEVM